MDVDAGGDRLLRGRRHDHRDRQDLVSESPRGLTVAPLFPGIVREMMNSRVTKFITVAPWLVSVLAALVCLGLTPDAKAASGTGNADHRLTVSSAAADRNVVASRLAIAVRDLRRSADLSVQKPSDAIRRLGFSTSVALVKAMIREARSVGGLVGLANSAQLALTREIRRVHDAWKAADQEVQVAGIVRQLESLAGDAARASGARSSSEANAFKRAHLADVRHAGRRWLVDRKVGRQGAVIIARGVRNPRLRNAVEQLYRPGAKIGDGGTAAALLAEVRAGCRGAACRHYLKASQYRQNLLSILSQERLSVTERGITGELVGALSKSIRAAGGR